MLQQLDTADRVRRKIAPRITKKRKAEFGQFMTPANVARFMTSLFPPSTLRTCRLLDAGAGVGTLSCAFLDRWVTGGFDFESAAENPLLGITPIMNWVREFYNKEYAPNTREAFRRQTMHQFCHASIVLYNPDKPDCIRGIHCVIENILPVLCWGRIFQRRDGDL
ncbi:MULTISPECIES: hypothetical protein [Photorhabdus]|uniref:Photorhabdus luminescens subsp. laumondii TTO1 complete genome segment 15/17 n=3 Tax=Photorhabdus TaxID=29487 RepID=Q7MZS7_PHOLL|nr:MULTISPECIES: hypothetical protein [Photorhabdus]AWK43769.1 hypothetical protein A4R40_20815 [Photorhabdus laumondii subsp. laumondii]CAE16569.1 unnamed protein product [Photorhabdus laumondii subsp. laumondii TTO1]